MTWFATSEEDAEYFAEYEAGGGIVQPFPLSHDVNLLWIPSVRDRDAYNNAVFWAEAIFGVPFAGIGFKRMPDAFQAVCDYGLDGILIEKEDSGYTSVMICGLGAAENPPFSGWRDAWWLEKMPRDVTKIAYRRKRDALLVFMDWNGPLIDLAFNGPSQKHLYDSFDNFNHQYELKGKRRIDNFAKAVWFALPAGSPYYIEDIDVNMLNDTQPMLHNAEEQQLSVPDYVEERRLVDLEAEYWEAKYSLLPEEDEEVPF